MTNKQTKEVKHLYHEVLQWVADGKEIECHHTESDCYLQLDTNTILRIVLAGTDDKSYKQPQDFRLKPQRHVHQDLIDAYAKGAEIQYLTDAGKWVDREIPLWREDAQYRIKPEPKPDVVRYIHITKERSVGIARYFPSAWAGAVLEVTLDGETGEIKHSKKYQGDFND